MAEELQALIERLQKDALDAASRQAAEITSAAEQRAAALVGEAEHQARDLAAAAEREARTAAARGRETLQLAARDLLGAIGAGIDAILARLTAEAVDRALDPDLLRSMLLKLTAAYAARDGAENRVEILLGAKDREQLADFFRDELAKKIKGGVEIRLASDIRKGFRVGLADGRVYHDFTREAIAGILSEFLQPRLAELVRQAAKDAKP